MSLINDMLRDLEKRQKSEVETPSPGDAPVAAAPVRSVKKNICIGISVVLTAVVIWVGVGMVPRAEKVSAPLSAEQPQSLTPMASRTEGQLQAAVPAAELAYSPQPEAPAAAETPPVVSPVLPLSPAEPVQELLALKFVTTAEQTALRVSFSKLPHYRLSGGAVDGSPVVVSFKDVQIGTDFSIPPLTGALIKRLSLVPQAGELRLLVDLERGGRLQGSQLVELPTQGFELILDFVLEKPVATVPVAVSAPPLAAETQPVGKIKEPLPPAKVEKKANKIAADQQAYMAGLQQLQAGRVGAATASFKQAVIADPNRLDARLQLISLLQQQKKFAAAEKYTQQGLKLEPDNPVLRKLYARQLLQEHRQNKAIELLRVAPLPSLAQDPEYHALLAAALQAVGEYRSASTVYARLVKVRPQNGLWWLGMAVSLEQSGQRDEARGAYLKALTLPGLRPDLQDYIQGRLQAL